MFTFYLSKGTSALAAHILLEADGIEIGLDMKVRSRVVEIRHRCNEVAQRAGVSKQTVYSHFASKEALFKACIRAKVAGYGFDETTEVDDTDLRAALLTLTRRFVDLLFHDFMIQNVACSG